MKKIRHYFNKPLLITLLSFSVIGSVAYKSSKYFEISKHVDIFISLYKEIDSYYVDDISPSEFIRTGIDAMLSSLDPYTTFISESEVEDYRFMTTGEYGGIGAVISKKGKYIQVVEPYENSPADKAGLRAGDLIIEVDGKSVEGKSTTDVTGMLKGEPNSEVTLKILRGLSEEEVSKTLVREEIKVKDVPYYGMVDDEVGYVKLSSFKQNCSQEIKEAMVDLKENHGMEKMVLDLRGNPGGILNEAVRTVALFVDKGELVVSTKGKIKEWQKEYHTYDKPVDKEMPIVVLTSSSSASASEIVSGAIQDLDRGVVLGEKTFGKGLVQQAKDLPYNAKVKMTIAKYYIPSGRCIQALDYSKKDNKRPVKYPDSLKTAFQTKGGRTVYDGDGVMPDIEVEPIDMPEVIVGLYNQRLFFEFANRFREENDSIPPARVFTVSDELYDDFVEFLEEKDYDYTTNAERKLANFKETAIKENYFEAIEPQYDSLYKALKHDKSEDLQTFKKLIVFLLAEEIVSRYYYQKGRIANALDHDPQLTEALKVLKNQQRYTDVLSLGD